jgi:biopolymer transport protein TolR
MAMLPGASEDEDDDSLPAEINVTPFVDVMLVLLIVFMVAAPLMTVGVPINLPRSTAGQAVQPAEPIVVSLDAEGGVWLDREAVPAALLAERLRPLAAAAPDRQVLLRADRELPYGAVMGALGGVAAAGFSRVSLIGEASQ